MNKLIQITPTVFGVIVPENSDGSDIVYPPNGVQLRGITKDGCWHYTDLPLGNYKIHGTCTLPNYDFDFIYGTGSYDTMTLKMRIQKAINDLGLYCVNPYKKPENYELWEKYGSFTQYGESLTIHSLQWQSAESKTVKGKILIIEKK